MKNICVGSLAVITLLAVCSFATNPTQSEMDLIEEPIDDQTRIDMILEAYRRLPSAEIERLGLDPRGHVAAGSPEADLVFATWQQRVDEIREITNLIAKPVSIMEDIILSIKDKGAVFDATDTLDASTANAAVEDLLSALQELESLVSDVDNARDFHTIGGWTILSSLLGPKYPIAIRSAAAWAIGTAVKNDYDYQLWVLEPFEDSQRSVSHIEVGDGDSVPISMYYNTSTLQYLLDITQIEGLDFDLSLRSKVLYALAAAIRGNPDVQLAVCQANLRLPLVDIFKEQIHKISQGILNADTGDVIEKHRYLFKIWSLLHDLVEERRYLHIELAHNLDISSDLKQEMLSMKLMGDDLISSDWLLLAIGMIGSLSPSSSESGVKSVDGYDISSEEACKLFDVEFMDKAVTDSDDEDHLIATIDSEKLVVDSVVLRTLENSLGFVKSVLAQTSNPEKTGIKKAIVAAELSGRPSRIYYRNLLTKFREFLCKNEGSKAMSVIRILRDVNNDFAQFS